jgi:hypothetical protein
MGFLVVMMGGSKAAHVTMILVAIAAIARNFYIKAHLGGFGMKYLLVPVMFIILLFSFDWIYTNVSVFIEQAIYSYDKRDSWITADRFAPAGQMFRDGFSLFGKGPLTYYNPITKTWLYNAGLSTIYSLYIDIGTIGLLIYFAYYARLLWTHTRSLFLVAVLGSVLLCYSMFSLTLTDLAFVFVLNFVLKIYQYSEICPPPKKTALQ